MSDTKEATVFITNGHNFIGPYLPGDMALVRGRNDLEQDGLPIYVVTASTLIEAKEAWRRASSDAEQAKK